MSSAVSVRCASGVCQVQHPASVQPPVTADTLTGMQGMDRKGGTMWSASAPPAWPLHVVGVTNAATHTHQELQDGMSVCVGGDSYIAVFHYCSKVKDQHCTGEYFLHCY